MHYLLNMKDSHSFRLSWICFFKLHLKRRGPLFVREFPSMADFDPTDYDGHADDPLAVLEGQEIDELGGKGPQVSWWNWASQICFFGMVLCQFVNQQVPIISQVIIMSQKGLSYHEKIIKNPPSPWITGSGVCKMILTDSQGWRLYFVWFWGFESSLKKMRPSLVHGCTRYTSKETPSTRSEAGGWFLNSFLRIYQLTDESSVFSCFNFPTISWKFPVEISWSTSVPVSLQFFRTSPNWRMLCSLWLTAQHPILWSH